MPTLLLPAIGSSGRETSLCVHQLHPLSSPLKSRAIGQAGCGGLRSEGKRKRETYVAFPANHLVAIVLASQSLEGRLDDTATETEDEMEGRFLYYK